MKKIVFIFLLLPVFASAQIVNIPDANFKAYLVGNSSINTNGDGEIQVTEASAFTWGGINVFGLGISDLTGIEAFTSVTYLECHYNSLTSLDVSQNTALQTLYCEGNSLTSLDVSNNIELRWLATCCNSLTSLDVSNNTKLQTLGCSYNSITSMDVSNNPALIMFSCEINSLTSLDIRNGNNVNSFIFEAANNPNLTCISVDDTAWANANWWDKDPWASFSNDCNLLGIEDNLLNQPSITSHNNTITIKGKGTATIFNLQGQRVHQSKLTGNNTISLDRGIYLVRVTLTAEKAGSEDYRGAIPSVTKKVYLNN
ncbi:MAG: T9SS type A sorting domain-containing protein [Bacteroidetes bacterium]|nr:T9SS type A sorting domain-containing protein [Bacteroidota bacterium]